MAHRRLPIRAGTVLAIWAVAGCNSPVSDPNSTVPGKCSSTAPLLGAQKTDILFVVDNSESMSDKQAEVARELPAFVNELQKGAGVQQDFQMRTRRRVVRVLTRFVRFCTLSTR